MRRGVIALVVALALVAAACGDDDSDTTAKANTSTSAVSKGGGASTYDVSVDHKTDGFNLAATAYFPNKLTVHAGDTVDFKSVFTGEPHTVTFGTLVDAGLPKALAAGPDATDEPAELKKLPALLPEGPGDANQMAANPCFLATGDPPADAACPKVAQPAFDGTQVVYNSGFLPDGADFEVKLADDIKPGTYNFFCLLHREGMTGQVTVVADGAKAQTPDEVAKAGKDRVDEITGKLANAASALEKGTLPPFVTAAKPGEVVAGGGDPSVEEALIAEFGPKETKIPVGGAVTWTIIGPHTISFNAPEDVASSILVKGGDGAYHANEKAAAPSGNWPPQPPDQGGPPPSDNAPPPPPKVIDGGSFDGTGFHSTGLYLSFPPALTAFKVTFTKAGTYKYKCLIHPDMEGTVTVG
jgi:plastocyanin